VVADSPNAADTKSGPRASAHDFRTGFVLFQRWRESLRPEHKEDSVSAHSGQGYTVVTMAEPIIGHGKYMTTGETHCIRA